MFTAIASLILFAQALTAPMPPFRRVATVQVSSAPGETPYVLEGSTLFFATGRSCEAYNLVTLRRTWKAVLPRDAFGSSTFHLGPTLFVSASDQNRRGNLLIALDAASGKSLWSLKGTGRDGTIGGSGDTVYLNHNKGQLDAVNTRTHKVLWKASLPTASDDYNLGPKAVVATHDVVVVNSGNATCGFSQASGKVLWTVSNSYLFQRQLVTFKDLVWVPTESGSACVKLLTGRVVWRSEVGIGEYAGMFGGHFVSLSRGQVRAVDPTSGAVVWSVPVGNPNESDGNQAGKVVANRLFIRGLNRAVILSANGDEIWNEPAEIGLPNPIFASGGRLVCFDGIRLLTYVHGSRPPLPSDSAGRKALATNMLAHYDDLDESEKRELEQLGDDAFEPMLSAFVKSCEAYDRKEDSHESFNLYGDYHALAGSLMKIASSKRTEALLTALSRTKDKGSAKPALLEMLARNGDPKVIAPYFVKELEGFQTPGFEMYESNTYVARSYVETSKDPVAVAFMLRQLKNPKADPTLREAAYDNLAETGGAEGLAAVLAEKHSRKLLPSLPQRVVGGYLGAGEFGTISKVLQEKMDGKGRTWGLIQCGILGSSGDLWLAEKVNGKWVNPLFSGVSLEGISRWAKNPPPEPKIGGKTAKELVAGAWFDVLVTNQEIRKDTTGCGVTDLEKKRLGLDPTKRDTDGDGDADDVDPWPNAPQRALTDAEQVLAAAFEARYHFDRSQGPALFFAPWKMAPFEMPGREGPTLWVPNSTGQHDWSLPLEQCYEQGVAFINFDGDGGQGTKGPDSVVHWSGDRSEATVTISTYYGGLNGTGYEVRVRRFGKDWVVVGMRMAYVS